MYVAAAVSAISGVMRLSLAMSAIGISSVLLISIVLKVRDRALVVNQFSELWGKERSLFLLYFLLGFESLCLVLNLIYGSDATWVGVSTSGLLFFGALIGTIIFRKGRGCPCFGAASTSKWFSPALFGGLFFLSAASFNKLIKDSLPYAFVPLVSAVIALSYFAGFYGAAKTKIGKKITFDRVGLEINYAINVDEFNVYLFTSTTCSSCLALMRFIDKISDHFSGLGKFYIDIEGISPEEDTSFAGCEVLSGPKLIAQTLFSIDARPSVVIVKGDNAFKYIGFQPCALALSQLISMGSPPS